MVTKYLDTEHDIILTVDQLTAEFNELSAIGGTAAENVQQYISNCLTRNNGTLEAIKESEE